MSDQAQVPATVPSEGRNVQIGATPQALVPTSLGGVWKFAEIIAASGMAPRDMNTPEKISVAIMHGMEVGLTPMAALQSIAVVNGRPTIWGDGALGLIRASGQLQAFEETISGEGDARTAVCRVQRKGEHPLERKFSWADAKKANLSGKTGPWQQYPDRMMAMRARAFALRDAFADILRGLSIREEQEDVVRDKQGGGNAAAPLEPPPAPTAPPPPKQEAVETAQFTEVTTPPAPPQPEPKDTFDAEAVLAEMEEQCKTAQTPNDIEDIRKLYESEMDMMTRTEREKAEYILEEAEANLMTKTSKQATEEGRQRVEAAGGKGIKEYMDEDRQDDKLADDLDKAAPPAAPTPPDPFVIPVSFKDVDDYRQWVMVMCSSATTQEHAKRLRESWGATQTTRQSLGMSMPTIQGLRDLVAGKLGQIEKP